MTRYGSSCQISESLVQRIKLLGEKKEGMSNEEWQEYSTARIKSYDEESSFKLMRLAAKKALRKEKAKLKREGKIKDLIDSMV